MLCRAPGIGKEEFCADLAERHPAFAWERIPDAVAKGVVRYVQNHVTGGDSPWDCITEILFEDTAALQAWSDWYLSPAAAEVRADEDRVIDKSRRVVVVAEEVPTPQPGA